MRGVNVLGVSNGEATSFPRLPPNATDRSVAAYGLAPDSRPLSASRLRCEDCFGLGIMPNDSFCKRARVEEVSEGSFAFALGDGKESEPLLATSAQKICEVSYTGQLDWNCAPTEISVLHQ